jgi:hypothetical protein
MLMVVKLQNRLTDVAEKAKNDTGEVASWLIVAAALAAAAVLASGTLKSVIAQLAQKVATSAGVGGGGGGAPVGP